MSEEGKDSHHHHRHHHHEESQPPPPAAEYDTFQPPPQPVVGLPQPVPPPGALEPSEYYAHGYQSVPGYVVDERRPVREPRLPCCGIGLGWFFGETLNKLLCIRFLLLVYFLESHGVVELDHLFIPSAKTIKEKKAEGDSTESSSLENIDDEPLVKILPPPPVVLQFDLIHLKDVSIQRSENSIIFGRFITGFIFAAIPWYVAAFILLCTRSVDHREKPGYVACTIAAVLAAIALIFGLTRI